MDTFDFMILLGLIGLSIGSLAIGIIIGVLWYRQMKKADTTINPD